MMYKYISETEIEKAPKYIKEQGTVTSNPPEDKLRELGYKVLIIEPCPETQEGFYRTPIYTDGEVITQGWSEEIKEGESD